MGGRGVRGGRPRRSDLADVYDRMLTDELWGAHGAVGPHPACRRCAAGTWTIAWLSTSRRSAAVFAPARPLLRRGPELAVHRTAPPAGRYHARARVRVVGSAHQRRPGAEL